MPQFLLYFKIYRADLIYIQQDMYSCVSLIKAFSLSAHLDLIQLAYVMAT